LINRNGAVENIIGKYLRLNWFASIGESEKDNNIYNRQCTPINVDENQTKVVLCF